MMKLKRIDNTNATVVDISDDIQVLFSYSTPVAAFVSGRGYLRTDKHYSVTTSRHINTWIGGKGGTVVPQAELDKLVG